MRSHGATSIVPHSGICLLRVAGGGFLGLVFAGLLTACADPPVAAQSAPTISQSPYTPTPPRAVDLRTASQALSLQISAKGVPVDGLTCRTDGTGPAAMKLHCTVTTGGGAGHPEQIAEGTWNRTAGTVHLISVQASPSTPEAPLATVPVQAADEADIDAAQVTRLIRPALVATASMTSADKLVCGALHSSIAGCEVHHQGAPTRYFNVVLREQRLLVYVADT